ncbi:9034_t:CDS:1 [Racocetra fulgida]|uniref:9034_t:CDS:1 n=1 Tax=Racocetra fulgida TaxID=60492 RepID=A0A9N9BM42_9GLOM|nr:9034_t:CDS:1 [Racocetra fulgida]
MSRISLICLVRGQPVTCAFVVDIDGNKYISHLKDAIKKKKSPEYKHIAADKLRLWKIEISSSHDKEIANYSLDSQDELHATSRIDNYWEANPPAEHVHVIVVPPGTDIVSSEERKQDTSSETVSPKKRKESTSQKKASNKKQNKVESPVTSTNKKQNKVTPPATSTNKKKKEVAQPETTSNTKQNEKSTTASNKKRKEVSPPETKPNNKREKLTSSPVAPAKNRKTVTETPTSTPQDARLRKLDKILNDLSADVMEDIKTNKDTDTFVPESLNELCKQIENLENRTNLYYFKLGRALQDRLEDLIEKKHKNARELLNTEVSGHFTAGTDFKKEISKAQKIYEFFNDLHVGENRIDRVQASPTTISSLTKDDVRYIRGKFTKSDYFLNLPFDEV